MNYISQTPYFRMKKTVFFWAPEGLPRFMAFILKTLTSEVGQGNMDVEAFSFIRSLSRIK